MASVGGYRIHLLWERGSGPDPLPLVLTPGWSGSFVEFEAVLGPLAHPERFGGRVEDAFDVIIPSLPGYGWSSAPPGPITTRDIARIWNELMTSVLGYPRYVAQGGDWGSLVTSWLGVDAARSVAAIHLNMMGLRPYLGESSAPLTSEEEAWVARTRARLDRQTGYQAIQGTKPQTLAYALTDSPAGLAAWIAEKFHGWSGPAAGGPPFTMEQIITDVNLLADAHCEHRELALHRGPQARWHATAAGRVRWGADRLPLLPARPLSGAARLVDPARPPLREAHRPARGRALPRLRAAGRLRRGCPRVLPRVPNQRRPTGLKPMSLERPTRIDTQV